MPCLGDLDGVDAVDANGRFGGKGSCAAHNANAAAHACGLPKADVAGGVADHEHVLGWDVEGVAELPQGLGVGFDGGGVVAADEGIDEWGDAQNGEGGFGGLAAVGGDDGDFDAGGFEGLQGGFDVAEWLDVGEVGWGVGDGVGVGNGRLGGVPAQAVPEEDAGGQGVELGEGGDGEGAFGDDLAGCGVEAEGLVEIVAQGGGGWVDLLHEGVDPSD